MFREEIEILGAYWGLIGQLGAAAGTLDYLYCTVSISRPELAGSPPPFLLQNYLPITSRISELYYLRFDKAPSRFYAKSIERLVVGG